MCEYRFNLSRHDLYSKPNELIIPVSDIVCYVIIVVLTTIFLGVTLNYVKPWIFRTAASFIFIEATEPSI